MRDMYFLGCFFMLLVGAMIAPIAVIELLMFGTPIMGFVLAGCAACIVGGGLEIKRIVSQLATEGE